MSIPLDIALEFAKDGTPAVQFVKLILIQAIQAEADGITFALDLEAEAKVRAEREQSRQQCGITELLSGNLPKTFSVTSTFSINYQVAGRQHHLTAAPGFLFEPAIRILLNGAEIPYWTKGEAAGEFETLNPESKWRLTSPALDRVVQLQRSETPTRRE